MRGTEINSIQGYWLPPLAVILIGLIMTLAFSQIEIDLAGAPVVPVPAAGGGTTSLTAPGQSGLAPLFTPEVQYWQTDILRWSESWGLDPNLVATVMQIESCGDPSDLEQTAQQGTVDKVVGCVQTLMTQLRHGIERPDALAADIGASSASPHLFERRGRKRGCGQIRVQLDDQVVDAVHQGGGVMVARWSVSKQ